MQVLKFCPPVSDDPKPLESAAGILAEVVCGQLSAPPHYTVLRGGQADRSSFWARALCRAIAWLEPRKVGPRGVVGAISMTEVRVDGDTAKKKDDVTRFSRTNQALAPHTDSSYLADPHELVAFHMIETGDGGGETTIVPVEALLEVLLAKTQARLRDAIYPFGRGVQPILFGTDDRPRIRYYRAQIDSALADGATLETEGRDAIADLDARLAEMETALTFRLEPGDILLLNNKMALHGRSGFDPASPRLLHRLRTHAGRLA